MAVCVCIGEYIPSSERHHSSSYFSYNINAMLVLVSNHSLSSELDFSVLGKASYEKRNVYSTKTDCSCFVKFSGKNNFLGSPKLNYCKWESALSLCIRAYCYATNHTYPLHLHAADPKCFLWFTTTRLVSFLSSQDLAAFVMC